MESLWTFLPDSLLDLIIRKLDFVPDYLRFTAVCKAWRSAATVDYTVKACCDGRRPLPLLLVPSRDSSDDRNNLYNAATGKFYDFELRSGREYNIRICCGSSYGWLAFCMDDHGVVLHNPFLDTNPDNCVILATYAEYTFSAFIKIGSPNWTHVDQPMIHMDVAFYEGSVYVVDIIGKVTSFQIDSDAGTHSKPETVMGMTYYKATPSYLVKSLATGDLLLVRRIWYFNTTLDISTCRAQSFEIYKLAKVESNEGAEGRKLKLKAERVNELGDEALFVGINQAMSVRASDFEGCRPNSIYYTDYDICMFEKPVIGARELGIFDLRRGCIETHYVPDPSHKRLSTPIWITPTPVIDAVSALARDAASKSFVSC